MITVDCSEVLPIKQELLIYVSDEIGAIPVVKHHEFILSPVEDDGTIDTSHVTMSIKKYLDSIGEDQNFGVISKSENITIKSINGKKINKSIQPVHSLRTCCGL